MCFGPLCLYFLGVHSDQVGESVIPDLLDQVVGVWGAVNKKFGSESVDDNWDGLNIPIIIQILIEKYVI